MERIVSPMALLFAGAWGLGGCGFLNLDEMQSAPPVSVAAAQAEPVAATPQFKLDGTPVHFRYDPTSFPLKIEEAGEYQIDAQGAPRDLKLYVYKLDKLLDQDDDSGERRNARLSIYLEPGEYTLRVLELAAAQIAEAYLSVKKVAPLSSQGTIAPGSSVEVESREPQNAMVTVTIAEAGRYRIDATSSMDARMVLIGNASVMDDDDDGGEGENPRIEAELQPGEYQVRVWDYRHRTMTTTVSVSKL